MVGIEEQVDRLKDGEKDLNRIEEWTELTDQERKDLLADVDRLKCSASEDLTGLRILINQEYSIQSRLQDLKQRVEKIGQKRLQEKLKNEQEKVKKTGQSKIVRKLESVKRINSIIALDELIRELQKIRGELQYAREFELTINIKENNKGDE